MKRMKKLPPLPDAINCEIGPGYTQIPNEFLKCVHVSAKAKVVLCIALSHKQGWRSFITTIQQFMKESEESVRSAVRELEKNGYLIRFNYRNKVTKHWKGWLWVYTNIPNKFNLEQSLVLLDLHGLEIPNLQKKLSSQNPPLPLPGNPYMGNLRTNNTNVNNTKNSINVENEDLKKASNGYITPNDFFKFKQIYPHSRIGSTGEAITMWERMCNNKVHRPTWNRIERAIAKQKQTPRWQDPQFIPLASTWINQKRWLDDPATMINFENGTPSIQKDRIDKEANEKEMMRNLGYTREIEDDDED